MANLRAFESIKLALGLVASSQHVCGRTSGNTFYGRPRISGAGWNPGKIPPVLIVILFVAPPLPQFQKYSRACLRTLSIVFLFLSAGWTVRIVNAYYFPASTIVGQNVHASCSGRMPTDGCQPRSTWFCRSWFSLLEGGRTSARDSGFRVVLTDEGGTILGESDPTLTGSDPGGWRANIWMPNKPGRIDSWLIQSTLACPIGHVEVNPFTIPAS